MKRIYVLLLVAIAAGAVSITGCKKNQDKPAEISAAVISSEGLANDQSFVKLNDAISRFDPKYLQLVYKDKRTEAEISKASLELLQELGTNPENVVTQQKLANFYHFKTVEELKTYSSGITESLKVLDKKYDLRNSVSNGNAGKLFFKARGQLAKAKIDNYPNNARQTNGLWTEFVDQYFSEFDYNTYVYDESMSANLDGGGSDPCNGEKCCLEKMNCLSNAKITFWENVAKYGGAAGGALMTSFGLIGAKIGSLFGPETAIAGGIISGVYGGLLGGAGGSAIAYAIYVNQKDICNQNYSLCLSK